MTNMMERLMATKTLGDLNEILEAMDAIKGTEDEINRYTKTTADMLSHLTPILDTGDGSVEQVGTMMFFALCDAYPEAVLRDLFLQAAAAITFLYQRELTRRTQRDVAHTMAGLLKAVSKGKPTKDCDCPACVKMRKEALKTAKH